MLSEFSSIQLPIDDVVASDTLFNCNRIDQISFKCKQTASSLLFFIASFSQNRKCVQYLCQLLWHWHLFWCDCHVHNQLISMSWHNNSRNNFVNPCVKQGAHTLAANLYNGSEYLAKLLQNICLRSKEADIADTIGLKPILWLQTTAQWCEISKTYVYISYSATANNERIGMRVFAYVFCCDKCSSPHSDIV